MNKKSVIALIPARSGSKRVPDKNIRLLSGHPLLAYTIRAALDSGIFSEVVLSTDSEKYAEIGKYYGASVPFLRPVAFAGDSSPDYEWIKHVLEHFRLQGKVFDCYSILRPTSPFRQSQTIQRAWEEFTKAGHIDSLRAVEKCKQHPGKMWVVRNTKMFPLLPFTLNNHPWHSNQTQFLPEVYVQNASLEIAYSKVVFEGNTIAGEVVIPFFSKEYEGFDINSQEDWSLAERLLLNGNVSLPKIFIEPFKF